MDFLFHVSYTPTGTTTATTGSVFAATLDNAAPQVQAFGNYVTAPTIVVAFFIVAVVAATVYFRKWILKGLRGVTRTGGRRLRRR